ncbi:LAMI_0G13938g1_1 [Lachancea mirantina]|uniref:LAMI_0G13938g1_1 n=1 Tax=Lachancea mirantina TaxID=1230905 RepID=A0A1G4KBV5_9SACH|nr:LAMI_0G13938g1_1 [Lachancea mirantina]
MSTRVTLEKNVCSGVLDSLVQRCKTDPNLASDKAIHVVINTEKSIGIKNDFIPRIIPLSSCKMYKPRDLRILLITKDPAGPFRTALAENESTSDLFKMVISVRNLKSKYRWARLIKLFKEFDMVVADHRVQHLLPRILGRAFYHSNKKLPFAVQMSKEVKDKHTRSLETCDAAFVRAQLKSICKNAFYVPNKDNCMSIKIGEIGVHTSEEMTQNIQDIVQFLSDKSKRSMGGGILRSGIAALFVKTNNSVSLPLYRAPAKNLTLLDENDEIRL